MEPKNFYQEIINKTNEQNSIFSSELRRKIEEKVLQGKKHLFVYTSLLKDSDKIYLKNGGFKFTDTIYDRTCISWVFSNNLTPSEFFDYIIYKTNEIHVQPSKFITSCIKDSSSKGFKKIIIKRCYITPKDIKYLEKGGFKINYYNDSYASISWNKNISILEYVKNLSDKGYCSNPYPKTKINIKIITLIICTALQHHSRCFIKDLPQEEILLLINEGFKVNTSNFEKIKVSWNTEQKISYEKKETFYEYILNNHYNGYKKPFKGITKISKEIRIIITNLSTNNQFSIYLDYITEVNIKNLISEGFRINYSSDKIYLSWELNCSKLTSPELDSFHTSGH